MKFFLLALVVAPASVSTSTVKTNSWNAVFGNIDKKDAMSVMSSVEGMMGESQRKLQVAQRHHARAVKKVRKDAEVWLQDTATVYGEYFSRYSAELATASAELQQVVSEAKTGIAKSEAASAKLTDWKDPALEVRAKLGAQVALVERNLKTGERHVARKVQESEEHGGEVLEEEANKLGMKVGDMTPLVDGAKKTMEAVAEKKVPGATVASASGSSGQADLKALENKLAKASKKVVDITDDANKKMDGFLKKTDQTVGEKRVKFEKDLEVAQTQELAKERGTPTSSQKQSSASQKEKSTPEAKTAPKVAKK